MKLWFHADTHRLIFNTATNTLVFCDQCPCAESYEYEECAVATEPFAYEYATCNDGPGVVQFTQNP